jgi:hypothetical protein
VASVSLNFKSSSWAKGVRNLQERAPKAIARALNRSATSAEVVMVRSIAQDMALKQGDVRRYVYVRQATPTTLRATISASGSRVPLIMFNARERRGRGVTARLPGGAGQYPHAFIATMTSGHRGVFTRTSKARLPIAELHGPSIPWVFIKFLATGVARAEEQLLKNIVHELRFALRESAA